MGATQSIESSCILETPLGSLKGVEVGHAGSKQPVYRRYTGIPYAQPPVGALRWRRPQALPHNYSFSDEHGNHGDFTKFGPICPQPVIESKARIDNVNAAPEIANEQSEDCLYLNIWVPAGSVPAGGWPVQVHIHGGWLQIGNASQNNLNDPFDLFANHNGDNNASRIIVAPTYRLNVFGFLGGSALSELQGEDETPGNYGFWDQRKALEWVYQHIQLFGGDRENITVGGLSAGAHSSYYQLYYDSYLPDDQRLIRRAYMMSNGIGVQARPTVSEETSAQFEELVRYFKIPESLPAAAKVQRLREVPAVDLVNCIPKLSAHTFRATTDGDFIPSTFLPSIHDGSFAARLKANHTKVMVGEVVDENQLYRLVNAPSCFDELIHGLGQYYPRHISKAIVQKYELPQSSAAAAAEEWADVYGRILADCQVHATERGMIRSFFNPESGQHQHDDDGIHMTASDVFRYRIAWRAKSLDQWLKPEVGVCHAADEPIWWCSGFRAGYTDEDKKAVRNFLSPFNDFLKGTDDINWGTKDMKDIREMGRDGQTRIVEDADWDRCPAGCAIFDLFYLGSHGIISCFVFSMLILLHRNTLLIDQRDLFRATDTYCSGKPWYNPIRSAPNICVDAARDMVKLLVYLDETNIDPYQPYHHKSSAGSIICAIYSHCEGPAMKMNRSDFELVKLAMNYAQDRYQLSNTDGRFSLISDYLESYLLPCFGSGHKRQEEEEENTPTAAAAAEQASAVPTAGWPLSSVDEMQFQILPNIPGPQPMDWAEWNWGELDDIFNEEE